MKCNSIEFLKFENVVKMYICGEKGDFPDILVYLICNIIIFSRISGHLICLDKF